MRLLSDNIMRADIDPISPDWCIVRCIKTPHADPGRPLAREAACLLGRSNPHQTITTPRPYHHHTNHPRFIAMYSNTPSPTFLQNSRHMPLWLAERAEKR